MTQARRVILLVLAAIGWGSAATASKYALRGLGPLTLLAVELAVAVALLWTVIGLRGLRGGWAHAGPRRIYALLGFFEPGLAYAGLNFGLAYTRAVNGALLDGLESCFVVLLAVLVLRERLSRRAAIAALISAAGVILVSTAHATLRAGFGDFLVIAGVAAAAIYVILAGRQPEDTDSLLMTGWQFAFGLAFTLPLLAWRWGIGAEAIPVHVGWSEWLAAGIGGGIGFAGSFLLYNSVVTQISATVSGMALSLIPLFGLATAVLVLGEPLAVLQVAGGVLIVAGLVLFALTAEPGAPPGDPPKLAPTDHGVESAS